MERNLLNAGPTSSTDELQYLMNDVIIWSRMTWLTIQMVSLVVHQVIAFKGNKQNRISLDLSRL
jgi:hypothetical protein